MAKRARLFPATAFSTVNRIEADGQSRPGRKALLSMVEQTKLPEAAVTQAEIDLNPYAAIFCVAFPAGAVSASLFQGDFVCGLYLADLSVLR